MHAVNTIAIRILVIWTIDLEGMEGNSNNDFTGLLRRGSGSKSRLSPGKSLQQSFKGGSYL